MAKKGMRGPEGYRMSPCRLCGTSDRMEILYRFGHLPVAGYLEDDETASRNAPRYELALAICARDLLVQQAYDESTEFLTNRVYRQYQPTYSMSAGVRAYLPAFVEKAVALSGARAGEVVVEIGSNDGRMLDVLKSLGFLAIGFEPALNLAAAARERGLDVITEYFDAERAGAFRADHPSVPLVITRHTLEHAYHPVDFLRGIRILLSDGGLAVIEVPYLKSQMVNNHFEAMTFQHVSFFTVIAMTRALREAGLQLVDVAFVTVDGGSAIFSVKKTASRPSDGVDDLRHLESVFGMDRPSGYESFFAKVQHNRDTIKPSLMRLASEGRRIFGYGAGGKGQSMLNMLGLDTDEIEGVIDDTPGNAGRYIPGTGIGVVASTDERASRPDVILLSAPTHIPEILMKERHRLAGARVLATVPDFHALATDAF
jgi:C-methyltransferase C-terminal domain/Methyltransferase domain